MINNFGTNKNHNENPKLLILYNKRVRVTMKGLTEIKASAANLPL
jgi:hypothetical protein